MSLIESIENIARKSWEAHPASQPAKLGDIMEACVVAEDILQALIKHPSPVEQISDKVYMDLNRRRYFGDNGIDEPSIGVSICNEAANRFTEGGGIDYISFETHPEWILENDAKDKRWLKISGLYIEDGRGKRWETEYVFHNFNIRKREKVREEQEWRIVSEDAILQESDLNIIGSVFLGIRDQVMPLLVRSSFF